MRFLRIFSSVCIMSTAAVRTNGGDEVLHPKLFPLSFMLENYHNRDHINKIHPRLFECIVSGSVQDIMRIEDELKERGRSLSMPWISKHKGIRREGLLQLSVLVGNLDMFDVLVPLRPWELQANIFVIRPTKQDMTLVEDVYGRTCYSYGGTPLQIALHLGRTEFVERILDLQPVIQDEGVQSRKIDDFILGRCATDQDRVGLFRCNKINDGVMDFPSKYYDYTYNKVTPWMLAIINDDVESLMLLNKKVPTLDLDTVSAFQRNTGALPIAIQNRSIRVLNYLMDILPTTETFGDCLADIDATLLNAMLSHYDLSLSADRSVWPRQVERILWQPDIEVFRFALLGLSRDKSNLQNKMNSECSNGRTPLMSLAIADDDDNLPDQDLKVAMLLLAGVDGERTCRVDGVHSTPRQQAIASGKERIANMLKRGADAQAVLSHFAGEERAMLDEFATKMIAFEGVTLDSPVWQNEFHVDLTSPEIVSKYQPYQVLKPLATSCRQPWRAVDAAAGRKPGGMCLPGGVRELIHSFLLPGYDKSSLPHPLQQITQKQLNHVTGSDTARQEQMNSENQIFSSQAKDDVLDELILSAQHLIQDFDARKREKQQAEDREKTEHRENQKRLQVENNPVCTCAIM